MSEAKKVRPVFFIGPCVLESEDLAMEVAGTLKEQLSCFKDQVDWVFKGSFDKANRSSVNSFRGPGLDKGLAILEKVKKEFALKVITDFHQPEQAMPAASVVDYLQIPAFLCRQTDWILAGAKACKNYSRTLKIKKGQFVAPHDVGKIVEKAREYLPNDQILLTERGTCFGYNNLIVDMASFNIMKEFGVKVIYDATHSVQTPGSLGDATGGKREQIEWLAKAAVAAGADGIFMETHPEPAKALSDASTCLPLGEIREFVQTLLRIYSVV